MTTTRFWHILALVGGAATAVLSTVTGIGPMAAAALGISAATLGKIGLGAGLVATIVGNVKAAFGKTDAPASPTAPADAPKGWGK